MQRRTQSTDKVVKEATPPNKKNKSNVSMIISEILYYSLSHVLNYSLQEGTAKPQDTSLPNVGESSLNPSGELHKVPPLDQCFKKPVPNKNRRRPSQGHLKKLAVQSEDGKELV